MKTNRRNFFQTLGAGAAGLGLASAFPLASQAANAQKSAAKYDDQVLFVGDNIAIAGTKYGKVHGFILRDIYQFRGIPYGADTGGKNRFLPPQPPESWDDVRPAVWWGNSAPQIMDNRYGNVWASFVDHWNYADISEDCLNGHRFINCEVGTRGTETGIKLQEKIEDLAKGIVCADYWKAYNEFVPKEFLIQSKAEPIQLKVTTACSGNFLPD